MLRAAIKLEAKIVTYNFGWQLSIVINTLLLIPAKDRLTNRFYVTYFHWLQLKNQLLPDVADIATRLRCFGQL